MPTETALKRMAGILLMTDVRGKDGKEDKMVILQRRGVYDFFNKQPETFPNTYQVTAWGNVEREESFSNALLRICKKELGPGIENEVGKLRKVDGNTLKNEERIVPIVYQSKTEKAEKIIYATKIQPFFFWVVRLSPSSGGLVPITEKETENIIEIEESDILREEGNKDNSIIAMRPDAKEAVRQAFRML